MFNGGEMPLFVKAGMPGVFYGGAIVGQGLPQLTYMVFHADLAESKKSWNAFRDDPDWKTLSGQGRLQGQRLESDFPVHPPYRSVADLSGGHRRPRQSKETFWDKAPGLGTDFSAVHSKGLPRMVKKLERGLTG